MSDNVSELISQLINKAISLLAAGSKQEALITIDLALAAKRPLRDLCFTRALCLHANDNFPEALRCLEQEIALYPDNEAARSLLNTFKSVQKLAVKKNPRFNLLIAAPPVSRPPAQAQSFGTSSDAEQVRKIAVIGHCQSPGLAQALFLLVPNCEIVQDAMRAIPTESKIESDDFRFEEFDHVFMLKRGHEFGQMSYEICRNRPNVTFVPQVHFSGYHPDSVYIYDANGAAVQSPIGDYHSLLTYCSYLHGLSIDQCAAMFCPQVYEAMGFFDYFSNSLALLEKSLTDAGLDGRFLTRKWLLEGPFMYSVNHPKQFVLIDIAAEVCRSSGLPVRESLPPGVFCSDALADGPVFPIYPGIGGTIGSGEIYFKRKIDVLKVENAKASAFIHKLLNLKEFIQESYDVYKRTAPNTLRCADERIALFTENLPAFLEPDSNKFLPHPYKGLPDCQYWSKSITATKISEVNPVVKFATIIGPETKVATAGSCFAQHIARTLRKSGLNYFVTENGPDSLSDDERTSAGYGLFSARFGNIYTARQLLQLFKRAHGQFKPRETHWQHTDGTFVDPFRPNIGQRFRSVAELEADSIAHLASVRRLFEELDVFVFTLGLTEAWVNVLDGSVYPVAPGVLTKNFDHGQYRFVNFDYDQVCRDLVEFLRHLRMVNPDAKVILTVSPVPLVATYEGRHVLTSTTLSKSVLRAAADKISSTFEMVEYFPSYEIITGNFNRGGYFAEDLRQVVDSGVDHVMNLFIEHCTTLGAAAKRTSQSPQTETVSKFKALVQKGHDEIARVICDEDLLLS